MNKILLLTAVLVSALVGIIAACSPEYSMPPALLQAKEERDNKLCQARSALANAAIDYLVAKEQFQNTLAQKNGKEIEMVCNMLGALGRNDPYCSIADPNQLMGLKMQIDTAAMMLKTSWVKYRNQAEEIDRQFHLAHGLPYTTQSASGPIDHLPSCEGDQFINKALQQLRGT